MIVGMPSRQLDFPVFDADNHMYETTEALTKHLPDSHRGLIDVVGADNVVFGSDYPHVEGMAGPISFVNHLHGLPDDQVRKVAGGNMSGLMKVG